MVWQSGYVMNAMYRKKKPIRLDNFNVCSILKRYMLCFECHVVDSRYFVLNWFHGNANSVCDIRCCCFVSFRPDRKKGFKNEQFAVSYSSLKMDCKLHFHIEFRRFLYGYILFLFYAYTDSIMDFVTPSDTNYSNVIDFVCFRTGWSVSFLMVKWDFF